jgi:TonB family protein
MDRISPPDPRRMERAHGANDRLKRGWNRWLAGSIALAAVIHVVVLVTWPERAVDERYIRSGSPVEALSLGAAPELRIPLAPAEIRIRVPQIPVVAEPEVELFGELSASLPHFEDPALADLAALIPHTRSNPDRWFDYENFAPYLSYPRIRNVAEVQRFLSRHYDSLLQLTGATGVVQIAFWIDEGGEVWRAEVAESSGYRSLDRLALRLSNLLRFAPATRLGQPVRVQVRVPIIFRDAGVAWSI